MVSFRTRLGTLLGLALVGACASWAPGITYDRFDPPSGTYVNDTAGFALQFPRGWRVATQVDASEKLWGVLPLPSATEVSMRARTRDAGLWVETTRVSSRMELRDLQPAILRAYGEPMRQLRYQQVSLQRREARGLEYLEWVYTLSNPDFAQTFMEALFVKSGFAVRVRAKTDSEAFETMQGQLRALMTTITALDAAQQIQDRMDAWSR